SCSRPRATSPYGGISPGPRFFVPALPFLALGIAPAFARRPRTTSAVAVASALAMTASALVSALAPESAWHGWVWSMLAQAASRGDHDRPEHDACAHEHKLGPAPDGALSRAGRPCRSRLRACVPPRRARPRRPPPRATPRHAPAARPRSGT